MIDFSNLNGHGYIVGPHTQVEGQMVVQIVNHGITLPGTIEKGGDFTILIREDKLSSYKEEDRRREAAVALTVEQVRRIVTGLGELLKHYEKP